MSWYKLSITKLAQTLLGASEEEMLQCAFDIKYGDYDYTADLRYLDRKLFEEVIKSLLPLPTKRNSPLRVLVCGAGIGDEIGLLGGYDITAFDISPKALSKLSKRFPHAKIVCGDLCDLPFPNEDFDIYIALRTLQSHGVDIPKAISEGSRVLRKDGTLIVSVPSGYLIAGKTVKGMFDSKSQSFISERPRELHEKLISLLSENNYSHKSFPLPSEIVIQAQKDS